MKNNNSLKKKKIVWRQYIGTTFFLLIGMFCGLLMGKFIGQQFSEDKPIWNTLLFCVGILLVMYLGILVQLIIHEAGHLVFGLISGYKFSSFRIFSFMWVKEDKKIRLRRLTIAGTGGQCLMSPPDMANGKIPLVLYNLGGSLMNMIAGLAFLALFYIFIKVPFISTVMLMFAFIGFALAIMNGVPMRMGTIDNDGYNAFSLTGNSEAMHSFWVQLKVNEQIAKGIRLKDMPEEWFIVPSDESMKNSMVAVMGVFACNRLLDAQKFEEADKLMAHMLEIDSGMVGLHRSLIICDRIYCELIGQNRCNVLEGMLTKEQKKFIKQMKNFPSVLRTEYAYALLCEKDVSKADKLKAQFEKRASSYPYQNEMQSERELIEIAEKKGSYI